MIRRPSWVQRARRPVRWGRAGSAGTACGPAHRSPTWRPRRPPRPGRGRTRRRSSWPRPSW
ncbi:hypothetical protein TW83_09045 [Paracoccus sp. S4493]|nr:hypothetical protein TW83_09045 [Paracoccus sp. S4493]